MDLEIRIIIVALNIKYAGLFRFYQTLSALNIYVFIDFKMLSKFNEALNLI